MKKTFLILLVLLGSLNGFAQEDELANDDPIRSNEVKINALFLVVGAFDVTYERLLNQESGVGLNVFIPYDSDIKDNINYFISPYYRLYFGNKYASGFFLEGFGMLNSVNNERYSTLEGFDPVFDNRIVTETETNFALGIATGGKWYTNSGFVGEVSIGFGRNILSSDYDNDFVGKLAITVGYRF